MAVVRVFSLVALVLLLGAGLAVAQSPPAAPAPAAPAAANPVAELATKLGEAKVALDTIWVIVAACLVFLMNLGFACVESGFCRAKNTVTIMAKNFIVFAVSSVAFLLVGFGIMFGDGTALFGTQGLWFVGGADGSPATGDAYRRAALGWGLLRATIGIRVSADEEREGLDVGEHGISAYPEFHASPGFAQAAAGAAVGSTMARMPEPAVERGR